MSEIEMMLANDYKTYSGKCKEMSEDMIAKNPELKLVRGHYYCPIWNRDQPHWWCVAPDGTIVDPTARQFPSKGMGMYTPFNGIIECDECGKEVSEENAKFESNYAFCSSMCFGRFVGVF